MLKYDDVMNDQRREVYAQRREFMKAPDVSDIVSDMRAEIIDMMVTARIPEKAYAEQWEATELAEDVRRLLNLDLPVIDWAREEGIDEAGIHERITRAADAYMAAKAANFGPELMRYVEKNFLLQILDQVWKEHLLALDHLRQGIVLRAYGQRDPLNEYKTEAFALFNAMLAELKERVTMMLARADVGPGGPPPQEYQLSASQPAMADAQAEPALATADDMGFGMGAPGTGPRDIHPGPQRRHGPERSDNVERHTPQCGLPVRVGEEVQALPWAGDVRGW